MFYSIPFTSVSTGAVADTFKTIAAVVNPDVIGNRFRVRSLTVCGGDATPADATVIARLHRIADLSAGTAGTGTAVTPVQKDALSVAAVQTAKVNYTAEPTAYESLPVFSASFNARSGLVKVWSKDDAPVFDRDQVCGLTCAPRAGTAVALNGTIEIEQF